MIPLKESLEQMVAQKIEQKDVFFLAYALEQDHIYKYVGKEYLQMELNKILAELVFIANPATKKYLRQLLKQVLLTGNPYYYMLNSGEDFSF